MAQSRKEMTSAEQLVELRFHDQPDGMTAIDDDDTVGMVCFEQLDRGRQRYAGLHGLRGDCETSNAAGVRCGAGGARRRLRFPNAARQDAFIDARVWSGEQIALADANT